MNREGVKGTSSQVIIYQTPDGNTILDVQLEDETVWLTQSQMIELFGRERTVITKHINIYLKKESLMKKAMCKKMHIANSDKPVKIYNLDVIISVGYRVKSQQGTQFRIWANKVLKEYLVKGFVVKQQAKVKQLQKALDSIKILTGIAARSESTNEQAVDILQVVNPTFRIISCIF